MTGAGVYYDDRAGVLKDFAYFTSHVRGDVFGGEIFAVQFDDDDVIDNPTALNAEASIFDNTADYNDLTIDLDASATTPNPKLWVVGDNNARGAVVRNIALSTFDGLPANMNNPTTADYQQSAQTLGESLNEYHMPILGPSGNSISIPLDYTGTGGTTRNENSQLWVVAGGTSYGGLVVMDKDDDSRLLTRMDVHNAKHFDMGVDDLGLSGLWGAFLWGDGNFTNGESNLRIFNTSTGPFSYKDYLSSVTLPATPAANQFAAPVAFGDVTFEGKNAIDVDGEFIYMAMGSDGVKKVLASSGTVVDFYAGPTVYGGNGLANGLVVDNGFVYVAWGASGLVILDLDLDIVGQYNGIGSCNYVAVAQHGNAVGADDILFAGFGTGGIVMFKKVDQVNP